MMTTEQIRRRVAELGEWFHNLDLGGVKTAPDHFLGDYPAVKWQRFSAAIPDDLRGTWFDRMMTALEPFEVTLTFCFIPESKGINPHHTSAPHHIEVCRLLHPHGPQIRAVKNLDTTACLQLSSAPLMPSRTPADPAPTIVSAIV